MKPERVAKRKVYQQSDEYRQYKKDEWVKIKANPERHERVKAKMRKWRTGFTPELFNALLEVQNGCCAICHRRFSETSAPRADHCHDTKSPRGLLCHHCNIIEGMVKSMDLTTLEFADRLHAYLDNPPSRKIKRVS